MINKKEITLLGRKFTIEKSSRKNKQFTATSKDKKIVIHFGDSRYPEFPDSPRGDNYCARSSGIQSKEKFNANVLSRKLLWGCKGKKSYSIENEKDLNINIK